MRTGNIMELMTIEDMARALKRTRTALINCGGVEQHGYHLPLSCDFKPGYEIVKEVSRRTGCLALPPLTYSFSGGTLPGTTDITPKQTTEVVAQIGRSLYRQGVRNFIILATHCGGEHLGALRESARMLANEFPDMNAAMAPVLRISKTWQEIMQRQKGEHAGEGETSLMMHCFPELVKARRPVDKPIKRPPRKPHWTDEFVALSDSERARLPKPKRKYGVAGDPTKATAKTGKILFDECVDSLVKLVKALERRRRKGT